MSLGFFISLFNAQHVSDVLTSETCWALNNEIKKPSDIKLVSLYSTIKMMQGPINIILQEIYDEPFHSVHDRWDKKKEFN